MLPATHSARGVLLGDPFDAMIQSLFNGDASSNAPAYGVDVREDASQLVIEAELPGFKKEQIDLTLDDGVLTITAERNASAAAADSTVVHRQERRFGKYVRSFRLPPTVDASKVDAKLEDGVLTLTLAKREEAKPRKIVVK